VCWRPVRTRCAEVTARPSGGRGKVGQGAGIVPVPKSGRQQDAAGTPRIGSRASVLECASPLALSKPTSPDLRALLHIKEVPEKSGRGLPHSKTSRRRRGAEVPRSGLRGAALFADNRVHDAMFIRPAGARRNCRDRFPAGAGRSALPAGDRHASHSCVIKLNRDSAANRRSRPQARTLLRPQISKLRLAHVTWQTAKLRLRRIELRTPPV
jgi:hypothetical protein